MSDGADGWMVRLVFPVALLLALAAPAAAHHPVALDEEQVQVGGRLVALTGHGDPVTFTPAAAAAADPAPVAADTPLATSWCGTPTAVDDVAHAATAPGPRIKVVYARASDEPDRFTEFADLIQADMKAVSDVVAAASGGERTLRLDVGTSCGPEYVDVARIVLPQPRSYYTVGTFDTRVDRIFAAVESAMSGMTGVANTMIYGDRLYASDGVSGVASLYGDDTPGPGNSSNVGGLNALLFGTGSSTFAASAASRRNTVLHEIGHNLGAVQDSAPNSTLAGHCIDVVDTLCYADGGAINALVSRCANQSPRPFDCGSDDYFAATPAAGSYLDRKWNLFHSKFLCPVDSCTGTTTDTAPTARFHVESGGSPVTTVPAGTTVTLRSLAYDFEGSVTRAWDRDGDGASDAGVTGTTTTLALPTAGTYTPRLSVTDAGGAVRTVTRTIVVTAAAAPAASSGGGGPSGSSSGGSSTTTTTTPVPPVVQPEPPVAEPPTAVVVPAAPAPAPAQAVLTVTSAMSLGWTRAAATAALTKAGGPAGLARGRVVTVPFFALRAGTFTARLEHDGRLVARGMQQMRAGEVARVALRAPRGWRTRIARGGAPRIRIAFR